MLIQVHINYYKKGKKQKCKNKMSLMIRLQWINSSILFFLYITLNKLM